jgi:5-methylcytosine-specific restriction protein A
MPRLTSLNPLIGSLAPIVTTRRDAQGHDRDAEPLRRLYSTAHWRKLRIKLFVRDGFTCQCGCGVFEEDSSLLVLDHIEPHRGDLRLFWAETNLQTLRASPCHNAKKQREEAAERGRGG